MGRVSSTTWVVSGQPIIFIHTQNYGSLYFLLCFHFTSINGHPLIRAWVAMAAGSLPTVRILTQN